jgi:hypothetical protein
MAQKMRDEGLHLTNLISPQTAHVVDPVTHAEQMRHIAAYAASGVDRRPRTVKFVTWSLKYSQCHWMQILGLDRHYERAEIVAHRLDDVTIVLETAQNITSFAIVATHLLRPPTLLQFGDTKLVLPQADASGHIVINRTSSGGWMASGEAAVSSMINLSGVKRPGLQGPIDDAFDAPFLCVRGTGTPWSAQTQLYAEASLERFAAEWHQFFRGDLPIKTDAQVTDTDIASKHTSARCFELMMRFPLLRSWLRALA